VYIYVELENLILNDCAAKFSSTRFFPVVFFSFYFILFFTVAAISVERYAFFFNASLTHSLTHSLYGPFSFAFFSFPINSQWVVNVDDEEASERASKN
jgi:hypothetical protein